MIEQIIKKAFALWHEKESIERERGFHASSAGWCHKKVILEATFPQLRKAEDPKSKNVLKIGNQTHDHFDDVLRLYSQETGDILWIQPWRLKSFHYTMQKIFNDKGLRDNPHVLDALVYGTPDGVLIHVDTGTLIIPDFKTSNERAFNYKVKGSRSRTHELQIGTYLPAIIEQLVALKIDIPIGEVSIVYINKTDHEPCVHVYDAKLAVIAAKQYWTELAESYCEYVNTSGTVLPPANPPEKWMCDYCSIFTGRRECNQCQDQSSLANLVGGSSEQQRIQY